MSNRLQTSHALRHGRRKSPPFALLSLIAAALSVAGCAGLPKTGPQVEAKAPQSYATAQTFTAPEAAWPTDRWWSGYGDAQLDGLMDEALRGSPTLAQAAARVQRAEALIRQSRAAAGPNLALNARVIEDKESYNNGIPRDFVPHGYNDYGRVTLDFAYELDFWGRNRSAIAAASSQAQAARADVAQARLILTTSVASAYADLGRLFAEREVAERSVALQESTQTLVAQRVANGLDTRGELRQAQARPPASRSDIAAIDEQIALTRNEIAALLGAGPDRGLAITRPAPTSLKPFGLPSTLAADLVGRRPDIVAARWRAEAATQRIGEARAAFYPNINLAASIGLAALHLDKLVANGSDIGSVGPALSLPIFDAGRLRANLRGAEAERAEAVASYDAALTQALRDVADVTASERSLASQLTESRASLEASEDAYRIALLRYRGGLSTYQDTLIAEQAVLARRRTVVDLESRALSLDVALVRALGGGFAGV
jgi:NodT family efflux transporter outer membrane factor (OMF) lipoprotein